MARRLAELYGVPVADFSDGYSRFLAQGQVRQTIGCRRKLNVGRKAFVRYMGISQSSLREWEKERKTVSRKSWERYFKARLKCRKILK